MPLEGVPVAAVEEVLGDAMEPVLRPLIYSEPLALVQEHREQLGAACTSSRCRSQKIVLAHRGRSRLRRRDRLDLRDRRRRLHGPRSATVLRGVQGGCHSRDRGARRARSRLVDRVFGLPYRSRLPGGSRASHRGQPGSPAAPDLGATRLADPRVRRPQCPFSATLSSSRARRRPSWRGSIAGSGHSSCSGLGLVPWTLTSSCDAPRSARPDRVLRPRLGRLRRRSCARARRDRDRLLLGCREHRSCGGDARGAQWPWFDILSSNPGGDRAVALSLAAFVELPTAVICSWSGATRGGRASSAMRSSPGGCGLAAGSPRPQTRVLRQG